MKFDNDALLNIMLTIIGTQAIFYLLVMFGFIKSIKPKYILFTSISALVIIGFSIYYLGLYNRISRGSCGTELFNSINIISIDGSFMSIFIYLAYLILNLILGIFWKQ